MIPWSRLAARFLLATGHDQEPQYSIGSVDFGKGSLEYKDATQHKVALSAFRAPLRLGVMVGERSFSASQEFEELPVKIAVRYYVGSHDSISWFPEKR